MRQVLILTILTLLFVHPPARADEVTPAEFCKKAATLAATIMEKRQQNAPMHLLIDSVSAISSPEMRDLFTAMIIEAYEKPRYTSDPYRRNAIQDFQNAMYLSCLKGTRK